MEETYIILTLTFRFFQMSGILHVFSQHILAVLLITDDGVHFDEIKFMLISSCHFLLLAQCP